MLAGCTAIALLTGTPAVAQTTGTWTNPTAGWLERPFGLQIALVSPESYITSIELDDDERQWVWYAMSRIGSIRPGATRRELEHIFKHAGGWRGVREAAPPALLSGVYSYLGCENISVDVIFKPTKHAYLNARGDRIAPEDPSDVIVKISKPFLDEIGLTALD